MLSFSIIVPMLRLSLAVPAALFSLALIGGISMFIGYLNCLILSFIEGKIIDIIGDLESTDPWGVCLW